VFSCLVVSQVGWALLAPLTSQYSHRLGCYHISVELRPLLGLLFNLQILEEWVLVIIPVICGGWTPGPTEFSVSSSRCWKFYQSQTHYRWWWWWLVVVVVVVGGNLSKFSFAYYKSYMDYPGNDPMPVQWETHE